MKLITVTIWLLCSTHTVLPQDQCSRRPDMANMKPFIPTSFLYYMDGILKKVNLLLDLKLDSESISRSFFDEAYKLMENGNTTSVNISRTCVEGIMDLVWPYKDLFKRGRNASFDEAALFFQWKNFGMMLDSWGKPGSGIFAGNTKWLGSYQQCKRLMVTKPCHAEIKFRELPFTIPKVDWGFCVPKACSEDDVGTMLSKFQELSEKKMFFSTWNCEKPTVYTKGNYLTITAIVILFALSVIGACVGSYKNYPPSKENACKDTSKTDEETYQEKTQNGLGDSEKTKEEESSKILHKKKKKESLWIRLICSFSIVNGIKSMTNMDVHPEAVGSINGLRFISHCIVTAAHAYGFLYSTDDKHFYLKVMTRYWFMPVSNGGVLFVNVFFLISGCVSAYLTMKAVQKGVNLNLKNVLIMYFHRFLRLTPSLGMSIAFFVFISPLLLRGPKTFAENRYYPSMVKRCHEHWWSTLLYINNFIPGMTNSCVGWTWFLANDTQMFICMPFVILLFTYVSKRTSRKLLGPFLITCVLCGVCMGVRFYLLYMKNLPGASLHNFSIRQTKERDYMGVWDKMYSMPYARFSPYLIGVFLGYTLAIERKNDNLSGLQWWRFAVIGWICCLAFCWYSIYTPFKAFSKRVYTSQEHLRYGTLDSTTTGIGFGTLIYLCHHNMGGVINSFLSWKGWIPIGRISFGAFLYHPIVCHYVYDVQEQNMTLVEAIFPIELWGIIAISYSLAAINYLLIEYPIANIEKILLGR